MLARCERSISRRCLVVAYLLAGSPVATADGASKIDPELAAQSGRAIDKALAFLAAAQQRDGGWTLFGQTDPAVTSLAAGRWPSC